LVGEAAGRVTVAAVLPGFGGSTGFPEYPYNPLSKKITKDAKVIMLRIFFIIQVFKYR